MKASYKIALIAAAVLLLLAIVYYTSQPEPGADVVEQSAQQEPDTEQAQADETEKTASTESTDASETEQTPTVPTGQMAKIDDPVVLRIDGDHPDPTPEQPPPRRTAPPIPPPTTTTTTTTAAAQTYVIQFGDTFSSIAFNLYGDESRWVDIAQANPLVDPTKLKVGQQVRLPATGELRRRTEPSPAPPAGSVTYTIQPGDTLATIAHRYYGDGLQWRPIYNANRDRIGPNPDKVKAGTTIVIPPAPSGAVAEGNP